ncbi:hypothetical protein SADUNF_Sadunf16G0073100 [Salix dunnii]|uniref:Uncharacterized protein n=1 Tax=Salix dunnii TaxID=1413687 RepID=A0A835JAV9_9ROSI|nr:hypothetical protein SADUNF_Sadunf16G0073100 [Salix dunnii]
MCMIIMKRAIPEAFRRTMSDQITTTKEFLANIEKRFVKNEKAEIGTLLTSLISMKYKGKGNIREYILEISHLASKLKALQLELSEDLLMHLVLISLPTQFNQFKVFCKNVVSEYCEHMIQDEYDEIAALEFGGGRGPDVDGFQIKPNSKHIWRGRCSLHDYDYGLIDITRESIDITISSVESQIYSQCNIYEAGQKKIAFKYLSEKAADKEKAMSGCIRSEGDLGTQARLVTEDGEYCMFHPSEYYATWAVEPPTDSLNQVLQHYTGWQSVPRPADQPQAAQ